MHGGAISGKMMYVIKKAQMDYSFLHWSVLLVTSFKIAVFSLAGSMELAFHIISSHWLPEHISEYSL